MYMCICTYTMYIQKNCAIQVTHWSLFLNSRQVEHTCGTSWGSCAEGLGATSSTGSTGPPDESCNRNKTFSKKFTNWVNGFGCGKNFEPHLFAAFPVGCNTTGIVMYARIHMSLRVRPFVHGTIENFGIFGTNLHTYVYRDIHTRHNKTYLDVLCICIYVHKPWRELKSEEPYVS